MPRRKARRNRFSSKLSEPEGLADLDSVGRDGKVKTVHHGNIRPDGGEQSTSDQHAAPHDSGALAGAPRVDAYIEAVPREAADGTHRRA